MAISPERVGRTYPAIELYTVSREAVRAFAAAVFAQDPAHTDPEAARALGHADLLAPPTFAIIVAQRAEAAVVADPAVAGAAAVGARRSATVEATASARVRCLADIRVRGSCPGDLSRQTDPTRGSETRHLVGQRR